MAVCGKEAIGANVAFSPQASDLKVGTIKFNGLWVSHLLAGDLAKDSVISFQLSEDQRGAPLCLGQV
jgi:hypothetical protein